LSGRGVDIWIASLPPRISAPRVGLQAARPGISLRQGTHKVAHRLTSTVWPQHSESLAVAVDIVKREGSAAGAGWSHGQRGHIAIAPKGPILRASSTAKAQAGIAADTRGGHRRRRPGKSRSRRRPGPARWRWDPARGGRAKGLISQAYSGPPVSYTAMQCSLRPQPAPAFRPVSTISAEMKKS